MAVVTYVPGRSRASRLCGVVVSHIVAIAGGCDTVVTFNARDFAGSALMTEEFLDTRARRGSRARFLSYYAARANEFDKV